MKIGFSFLNFYLWVNTGFRHRSDIENGKLGGRPGDPLKQQKITFARTIEGSYQEKADAVNVKFGGTHNKSTIRRWLRQAA
jgi:hypothetical protein